MSMEETAGGPEELGDTTTEVDEQPTEGGDVESPSEEPPSRQYVEIDDPDDRYVRVKVAGEDDDVPFSELVKGYSREADATRKWQEAAQLRQQADEGLRLQQAMRANPALTLQILAERYQVEPPWQQGQPEPQVDETEYADPLERAIAEERNARLELEDRLAQREADDQLQRAVGQLRTGFNLNDDDVNEIIGTAYRMNLPVESFPMIWKQMAFDRLQVRVQAARAREEQKKAETARRQASAAQAGQLIGNGSGAVGTQPFVDPSRNLTIREAIDAAFAAEEGTERI